MASVEQPSTPALGHQSDDLSSPPSSMAKKLNLKPVDGDFQAAEAPAASIIQTLASNSNSEPPKEWIQAYITGQYDYYNPITGEEDDDDDEQLSITDATIVKKIKYSAITAPEVYARFLEDPKDMSYNELYGKLALVNNAMVQLEKEYQQCSKALAERDLEVLRRKDEMAEAIKFRQEAKVREDDSHRERLARKFTAQSKLGRKQWTIFLKKQKAHDRIFLEQLKNEKFMEERQKAKEAERLRELVDLVEPPLEKKKSTIPDVEKKMRLGPTFSEDIVFEDMVMADAYGFPYSKHPTHVGRQPMPLKTTINGRTRPRSTATAPNHEAASSLPSKRVRRARIFADGSDASRSATPVPSMPVSNGMARSKAPSKLQDVLLHNAEDFEALPRQAEHQPRKAQAKKRNLASFQSDNPLPSTELVDSSQDGTTIAVEKPVGKAGKRHKVSGLSDSEEAREKEAEKERRREAKRAKQSEHMRLRWANGEMEKAKETRNRTLATKKADRLAAKHEGTSADMVAAPRVPATILPPIKLAPALKPHITYATNSITPGAAPILPKVATTKVQFVKKPIGMKPADIMPADRKPAEIKPAEKKLAAKKPAEKKPATTKSADKKPTEIKPADGQSLEKKPAAKRAAARKVAASTSAAIGEVRHSSRPRKPTAPFGSFDGAMDIDDDDFTQDWNDGDDSGDADVEMTEEDDSDE